MSGGVSRSLSRSHKNETAWNIHRLPRSCQGYYSCKCCRFGGISRYWPAV